MAAKAQDMGLEAVSFINLVRFHADELNKIRRGTKAVEIFTYSKRRSLRNYGILFLDRRVPGQGSGPGIWVSPRALKILNSLD